MPSCLAPRQCQGAEMRNRRRRLRPLSCCRCGRRRRRPGRRRGRHLHGQRRLCRPRSWWGCRTARAGRSPAGGARSAPARPPRRPRRPPGRRSAAPRASAARRCGHPGRQWQRAGWGGGWPLAPSASTPRPSCGQLLSPRQEHTGIWAHPRRRLWAPQGSCRRWTPQARSCRGSPARAPRGGGRPRGRTCAARPSGPPFHRISRGCCRCTGCRRGRGSRRRR
mmetsp:Transcript_71132/g.220711  ORF Transcript_71132/g.220711 Transcript_71132/m.220711 type:complete len:222 (-) Transcript_71132:674-1339(-)